MNEAMLPSWLGPKLCEEAFRIGKSVNFIRQACGEPGTLFLYSTTTYKIVLNHHHSPFFFFFFFSIKHCRLDVWRCWCLQGIFDHRTRLSCGSPYSRQASLSYDGRIQARTSCRSGQRRTFFFFFSFFLLYIYLKNGLTIVYSYPSCCIFIYRLPPFLSSKFFFFSFFFFFLSLPSVCAPSARGLY